MDATNNGNTWRAGLAQNSRQNIVAGIMHFLLRRVRLTVPERMGEFVHIVRRFGDNTFYAATDQQDYLRKISLQMLNFENCIQAQLLQQQQQQQQEQQVQQQQLTALQSQQSQQSQQPNSTQQLGQQPQQLQQLQSANQQAQQQRLQQPASVDSSGHSGTGLDHREVVWAKLQVLKDEYLQDMKDLHGMLTERSTRPMVPERLRKLQLYKDELQRMIPYLTVPIERVPREFNQDKVEAFEKRIVNIMEVLKRWETFKRRQVASAVDDLPTHG